ncbi:MAG: NADH-quinone oxidoreductase subunit C [Coriobacteriia bacterium]|nr:NADH-quinone oxidoreductase subunit C [Coriobacteriia bacterium]MCL2870593.1 NADH-quinone oxidoreductase subunit C [Coriobacteriia bacterium]
MGASPYVQMDKQVLIDQVSILLDGLGIGAYQIAEEGKLGIVVRADAEDVARILKALRSSTELPFEQLIDLFGADVRERIEITYRLRSLMHNIDLVVKCDLPYEDSYSSVGHIYAAAWLPERELCEMFGLSLLNHPNPKRLLTTEGLPPFLRKSTAIRTKEEIWD